MKPVLFGTLAVVISAIVAGPAFGRVLTTNTVAPSIPGNGVFPDLQRLRSSLTPAERQQLDAVTATARSIDQQQQRSTAPSIPGNGVFPDLQRLRSSLTPAERQQLDAVTATARSIDQQQQQSTALSRVHQPGVTSGYAALPPEVMKTPDSSSGGGGVNWGDAGIGIGIALAIAGGLVIVAIVGIRRDKATPAPA